MKNPKISKFWLLLALLLSLPLVTQAQTEIDPKFNPGNIISDAEILNHQAMNLSQIQQFLESKGGFLANYVTYNAHGTPNKSAAQIIYDAAANNFDCENVTLSATPTEEEKAQKCQRVTTVNPKFLLVLLQKEQSLIEDTNPKQSQLDWATGYGCPDGWTCNPYYKGFGKQVNSAALQFRYYLDHAQEFKYKPGQTYTFTNPYSSFATTTTVTVENSATAGLYNYTPHVFNGNYNFYKIWNRYFPKNPVTYYPSGTLLQVNNEPGVWLINNGQKKPFASRAALISRFDEQKIVTTTKEVLDNFATGTPIRFPNYTIIKTPDKNLYLLVDNKSRKFANDQVFKKIGFSKDEIEEATEEDLKSYEVGAELTATSTYAYGALIQSTKNGGVYFVSEDTKAPIIDKVMLKTKFKTRKIIKASEEKLSKYEKVAPVLFDDGELLKSAASPSVYLIDQGQKRPFATGEVFEKLGYKWTNVITVSPQLLYLYPNGEPLNLTN